MSSEMTEFKITSDLSAIRGQVISANFDEVQEWLETNLEPYRELAVTPETISTAKSYRANIRKVRDRIDDSRKEAKKAALAVYEEFEQKCKTLTSICDEAANAIDSQVKAIEEKTATEKIEKLHGEYIAMTDDEVELYCPWGCINNPKWRNATYKYDDAVAEITEAIESTRNDLETIRTMGGTDTPYLLDVYRQTRNLSAVIRKASELKTMRQREEHRERDAAWQREEDARRKAERERMDAEQKDKAHIYSVVFRVNCTKQQLIELGAFMKMNGIAYERCE